MPNFYAHTKLCLEAANRADPALREVLLRDRDAFLCGGFGPDPLFFHLQGTGRVRLAGMLLHRGSGAAAMEPFRKPVKERWPYAAAFASGFLLHYLLDLNCHPFVNQVAESGFCTHYALEGEYDRLLLQQDHMSYSEALPQRDLPESFLLLASRMAPAVSPRTYRQALQDFRWFSLHIGGWAGTSVHRVTNAISLLPGAGSIRGMVLGKEPPAGMLRQLETLQRHWEETADIAAAELEHFFSAVETNAPFSETLRLNYSGKEPKKQAVRKEDHGLY